MPPRFFSYAKGPCITWQLILLANIQVGNTREYYFAARQILFKEWFKKKKPHISECHEDIIFNKHLPAAVWFSEGGSSAVPWVWHIAGRSQTSLGCMVTSAQVNNRVQPASRSCFLPLKCLERVGALHVSFPNFSELFKDPTLTQAVGPRWISLISMSQLQQVGFPSWEASLIWTSIMIFYNHHMAGNRCWLP